MIALPCNICRAFLFGLGIVKVPACIFVVEALLNLSLSVCLCMSYGIEGVAWGTAIPVVVIELGVLLPYAIRNLGLSWTRLFREALWPTAIPLLALWSFAAIVSQQSWSHDDWRVLIAIAVAGGVVLGGSKWLSERSIRLRFFSSSVSRSA